MTKDGRDPPEDVPSVVVLEAMQDQERRETKALIEGFDRVGRPTGRARPERDFVGYYTPPAPRPTTIVRSRTSRLRVALAWASAAALMLLFGVIVAVLVTPPEPPTSTAPAPDLVIAPSATTTITSAVTSETIAETVIVAAPSTSSRSAKPRAQAPPAASASPTSKAAPRDDFLRDL